MKKVLISGATGFIGRHLLPCLSDDYDVTLLSRRSDVAQQKLAGEIPGSAKVVSWDLTEIHNHLSQNGVDIFIHLATHYLREDDALAWEKQFSSNVLMPLSVLELLRNNGLRLFLNTGTFFEFACGVSVLDETSLKSPFNYYARTKMFFQNVLDQYSGDFSIITLMLFSPYGKFDTKKVISHIVASQNNSEVVNLKLRDEVFDFVHADDVARAYVRAMEFGLDNPFSNEVFNIGTGVATDIQSLVTRIQRLAPNNFQVAYERDGKGHGRGVANYAKAASLLTWQPEITLDAGLAGLLCKEDCR